MRDVKKEESYADSSGSRSECGRLTSTEVVFINLMNNKSDVEVRCVEGGISSNCRKRRVDI